MMWNVALFILDYWFVIGFFLYWPMIVAFFHEQHEAELYALRRWEKIYSTEERKRLPFTKPKVGELNKIKIKHFFFAIPVSIGGPLLIILAFIFAISAIWHAYDDEINALLNREVF